jgi:hypothetical protein
MALLFLTSTFSLRGVPGDEHWDAQFGAPGVTNITYAVSVNDGTAYVAGVGTYGWIMGSGLNQTNVAMAVLGSTVFAAGTFTTALRKNVRCARSVRPSTCQLDLKGCSPIDSWAWAGCPMTEPHCSD